MTDRYNFMLSAKQGSIWYHFNNGFGMTRSGPHAHWANILPLNHRCGIYTIHNVSFMTVGASLMIHGYNTGRIRNNESV